MTPTSSAPCAIPASGRRWRCPVKRRRAPSIHARWRSAPPPSRIARTRASSCRAIPTNMRRRSTTTSSSASRIWSSTSPAPTSGAPSSCTARTSCRASGHMSPSDDLLQQARVAHLATADPAGRPHVMPVCFVHVDGFIYTPLDLKPKRTSDPRRLRRVRNIVANGRAALVVDRYDEDWSRLAYVFVEGEATLVADAEEERRAVDALKAKHGQYPTVPIVGVLRLRAERIVSWP